MKDEELYSFLDRIALKIAKLRVKGEKTLGETLDEALKSKDPELCFAAGLLYGFTLPDIFAQGFGMLVLRIVRMLEEGKDEEEILDTLKKEREFFALDRFMMYGG